MLKGNEEESNMHIKSEYNARGDKLLKIVSTDCGDFRYRNDEHILPSVGAFCKKCRTETAKPFYPIIMNGQDAYALKCEKCGSEYPMYRSMYIQRYIGHDLRGGGHVNPAHGMKSRKSCMDRTDIDNLKRLHKRIEKTICENNGLSLEKYLEFKKECNEECRKDLIALKQRKADINSQYEDEDRRNRSNDRKELIDHVPLKYVKNVGLVDTRTNQVVKF